LGRGFSNFEKREMIRRAHEYPAFHQLSHREAAARLGVSHTFVAKFREEQVPTATSFSTQKLLQVPLQITPVPRQELRVYFVTSKFEETFPSPGQHTDAKLAKGDAVVPFIEEIRRFRSQLEFWREEGVQFARFGLGSKVNELNTLLDSIEIEVEDAVYRQAVGASVIQASGAAAGDSVPLHETLFGGRRGAVNFKTGAPAIPISLQKESAKPLVSSSVFPARAVPRLPGVSDHVHPSPTSSLPFGKFKLPGLSTPKA
jgi:hypothetical protein